jgi:hypothetical protein
VLNAGVLQDLQKWNEIHQDAEEHLPNVLQGVVEKVRQKVVTTLDSKGVQIALDAIPNGTIPAGNIVKGLVWITVLCLVCPLSYSPVRSYRAFAARTYLNERRQHMILQFKLQST